VGEEAKERISTFLKFSSRFINVFLQLESETDQIAAIILAASNQPATHRRTYS
jgi:hypothetical protein